QLISDENKKDVQDVSFSPDGKLILTAYQGGPVVLWNAETKKPIVKIPMKNAKKEAWLPSARFSQRGDKILVVPWDTPVGNDDGNVEVYGLDGKHQLTVTHKDAAYVQAAISPDGKQILTGGSNGLTHLWDSSSGKLLKTFTHKQGIDAISFSPDGSKAVTTT